MTEYLKTHLGARYRARVEERQLRFKARVFEGVVKAAALAAQKPELIDTAPSQSSQSTHSSVASHYDSMAGDPALDSLIVKILAAATGPTKELRDLVAALPAVVQKERTAHDNRVADLKKQIDKKGNVGNAVPATAASKDAEIHKLKSLNGTLRSDNANQAAALQSLALQLEALKAAQSTGGNAKPSSKAVTRSAAPGTAAGSGFGQIRTGANQDPVLNLQPRFQDRLQPASSATLPPLDPRPQVGNCFPTTGIASLANPFQGNDRQVIHPSRIGQMDKASVTGFEPRPFGQNTTTLSRNSNGVPPVGTNALLPTQAGDPTPSAPTVKPYVPTAARSVLPSETFVLPTTTLTVPQETSTVTAEKFIVPTESWTKGFAGAYRDNSAEGYSIDTPPRPLLAKEANLVTQASSTQSSAASGIKRAASPSLTTPDITKKIKNEGTSDATVVQRTSEDVAIPNDGDAAQSTKEDNTTHTPLPAPDLEQVVKQALDKHWKSLYSPAVPNADMTPARAPISKTVLKPIQSDALQPSGTHARRDSIVSSPANIVDAATLANRQPVCSRCRFGKLNCDHKKPCQNCATYEAGCTYWSCEYGPECKSVTCWFSHEPVEKQGSSQETSLAAVNAHSGS